MTDTAPETRLTITVDGQPVVVRYQPKRFADYGHFEFTTPQAGGRIPMSETVYRSHFAPMWEVEEAPSLEAYAQALGDALARQPFRPEDGSDTDERQGQLALF